MRIPCQMCGQPIQSGVLCASCHARFYGIHDAMRTEIERFRRLHDDTLASVVSRYREGLDALTDPYHLRAFANALAYPGDAASLVETARERLSLQQEVQAGLVARLFAGQPKVDLAIDRVEIEAAKNALQSLQLDRTRAEEAAAALTSGVKVELESQKYWAKTLAREQESIHAWLRKAPAELELLYGALDKAVEAVSLKASLRFFVPEPPDLLRMAAASGLAPERFLDQATDYALASIAAISEAIADDPFGADTAEAVRGELGGSREPPSEAADAETRAAGDEDSLATGSGERPEEPEPLLVSAPVVAVEAILRVTGVVPAELPPLVLDFSLDHAEPAVSESDVAAAKTAYEFLFRLESQLRALVDRKLSPCGPKWFVQRSPGDIVTRCRERRTERNRPNDPLLRYADLGDLQHIICRNDNWPLFEPHFERKEGLQESFARLVPLRNDVMHMRLLTGTDLMTFFVEAQRIWRAIDRGEPEASVPLSAEN